MSSALPSTTPLSSSVVSPFSPRYLPITLSTLTMVALAAFDGMAVGAALPKIGGDLGVGLLPWVLTSFALTSTLAMLLAGPMIDALGVRLTFQITLGLFAAGSLFCALAPSIIWLIAARVLQGAGGGMVMAVAIANVGLSYPAEMRPRVFAANSTVWGTMALAGPAIVALLIQYTGWRLIFWLNLPLVALAGIVGSSRLPEKLHPTKLNIDGRGLVIIGSLITAWLFGVAALKWWSWIALAIGTTLAGLYWWHSGRTIDPVLDRRYFSTWPFGWLNMIPFTFFAGALAVDVYIPIFVQGGLGASSRSAAFAVVFLSIGWTAGSQITSRLLDRFANTQIMIAGFVVTLPALVICALIYRTTTPFAVVYVLSFLQGLGIGSVTNSTLSLLQRTATTEEMGRASSAHQFMRNLGGTLGTAVFGTVLLTVVSRRIGSVKPVQQLLSGDAITVSGDVQLAIVAGFRLACVLAIGFTIAGLILTVIVHRRQIDFPKASPV